MAGKREKPEEIVPKLRQVEVLHRQDQAIEAKLKLVQELECSDLHILWEVLLVADGEPCTRI